MEAATLQKKKTTISKGKLKKNIKNVLCRPDQICWPEITESHKNLLEDTLKKYKVEIPPFIKNSLLKTHWKELHLIPKELRPKPPKIKKVDGLLFGISECTNAIQQDQCNAIIIEASLNPRMIVQPVIELCISKELPVLCMHNLRKVTQDNFGVKTSCLGLKVNSLSDVRNEILVLSKLYTQPKPINSEHVEKMIVEDELTDKSDVNIMEVSEPPYLYRSNKKTRVFVPQAQDKPNTTTKKFIGQDFIEFSEKEQKNKSYLKMVMKRISNNPNRAKIK